MAIQLEKIYIKILPRPTCHTSSSLVTFSIWRTLSLRAGAQVGSRGGGPGRGGRRRRRAFDGSDEEGPRTVAGEGEDHADDALHRRLHRRSPELALPPPPLLATRAHSVSTVGLPSSLCVRLHRRPLELPVKRRHGGWGQQQREGAWGREWRRGDWGWCGGDWGWGRRARKGHRWI